MGIEVKGLDEAIARLGTVAKLDGADDALKTWAYRIQGEMATYPAPPPTSTYVRTGTLGRAWTTTGSRLSYTVGNNTVYAPYVQDADRQAWMHVGRWQTAQEVVEKHTAEIVADVEAGIIKDAQ